MPMGLGTPDNPCSIAAINLALTGELTDRIPACMSPVIGKWIIAAQDAMPDEIRNSGEWRTLLPLAAGTGRTHEPKRLALILDWMWGTVLPQFTPMAEPLGFGRQWSTMCISRTSRAAKTAAETSTGAAARAAWAATRAAGAVAARETSLAIEAAIEAAMRVAWAVEPPKAADEASNAVEIWIAFNPPAILRRLIEVGATGDDAPAYGHSGHSASPSQCPAPVVHERLLQIIAGCNAHSLPKAA